MFVESGFVALFEVAKYQGFDSCSKVLFADLLLALPELCKITENWKKLEKSGNFWKNWKNLEISRKIWMKLEISRKIWKKLEISGKKLELMPSIGIEQSDSHRKIVIFCSSFVVIRIQKH